MSKVILKHFWWNLHKKHFGLSKSTLGCDILTLFFLGKVLYIHFNLISKNVSNSFYFRGRNIKISKKSLFDNFQNFEQNLRGCETQQNFISAKHFTTLKRLKVLYNYTHCKINYKRHFNFLSFFYKYLLFLNYEIYSRRAFGNVLWYRWIFYYFFLIQKISQFQKCADV